MGGSGDATDIWKTITTWHSSDVYGSYVLYKGFESVFPYVWLYDLSMALNIDSWFFIKCYYIMMFAVSTTVLFPKIVEKLTGEKPKNYTKVIVGGSGFLFWVPAGALIFMVDTPSLFYFLILVLLALNYDNYSKSIWYWIVTGFMIGLNLCSSGQYTLAAAAVAVYLLIQIIKTWKGPENHINWTFCIILIVVAFGIKECNNYFLDVFVGGLKADGAWIPTSKEWMELGFLKLLPTHRLFFGADIYCDRGYIVLKNYLGDDYDLYIDAVLNGAYPISTLEYLNLFIHDPLNCLAIYGARLFLVLSPDRGYLNFIPLLIAYTLLFITLWYLVSKCREKGQMFSSRFWIVAAFVFAIIPCLILHHETRYAFQIQGLIFAVAICTSWVWCRIAKIPEYWKNRKDGEKPSKVNYALISYLFFLLFCFVMIALLYENSSDPTFYWWR